MCRVILILIWSWITTERTGRRLSSAGSFVTPDSTNEPEYAEGRHLTFSDHSSIHNNNHHPQILLSTAQRALQLPYYFLSMQNQQTGDQYYSGCRISTLEFSQGVTGKLDSARL